MPGEERQAVCIFRESAFQIATLHYHLPIYSRRLSMNFISSILRALGGVGIFLGGASIVNSIWDLHLQWRKMDLTDDPWIATAILVAGLVVGGLGFVMGRGRHG